MYVAADLASVSLEEALKGTAFDPGARTLFTCEGVRVWEVWGKCGAWVGKACRVG